MLGRIVAPTGAVGFALFAEERGWGLFNMVALPLWLELLLALFLLDLAICLQHRLFHYVPVLWWLHRMHHADLDVDVTTGARFHPFEILLSLGIKFLVVVPLGAAPLAVLLFEITLNATSSAAGWVRAHLGRSLARKILSCTEGSLTGRLRTRTTFYGESTR